MQADLLFALVVTQVKGPQREEVPQPLPALWGQVRLEAVPAAAAGPGGRMSHDRAETSFLINLCLFVVVSFLVYFHLLLINFRKVCVLQFLSASEDRSPESLGHPPRSTPSVVAPAGRMVVGHSWAPLGPSGQSLLPSWEGDPTENQPRYEGWSNEVLSGGRSGSRRQRAWVCLRDPEVSQKGALEARPCKRSPRELMPDRDDQIPPLVRTVTQRQSRLPRELGLILEGAGSGLWDLRQGGTVT